MLLRHNISALRQALTKDYDPGRGVLIATLSYEYPRGFNVPVHQHGSDQLIYATSGVMEISAGQSVWLIPPHFAIWIPARTTHSILMLSAVSMRTLYLRAGVAARMPKSCVVLHVTPLLRELIVETVRIRKLRERNGLHRSLRDVLVFQLKNASPMPTSVTIPNDPRARLIADRVIGNLKKRESLAKMSASAGASVRTIQRVFHREVGSNFEVWRRQVRLMKAVDLLVSGYSVKQTSYALGFSQPTAFVQMFREVLGATPRAWVQSLQHVS